MKTLTIFYDPQCGLCTSFRKWLDGQPKRIATEFVPYQSAEAPKRFPGIQNMGADRNIIVLADDGRWWQGEPAWLTCLWTTYEFRPWAFRLAAPFFRPFVRKAVHLLSENRLALSRLLQMRTDEELAATIESTPASHCADDACHL